MYLFQIILPCDYEGDDPPEVFCETDIYHPNIDSTEIEYAGSSNVCLNLLDSGTWSRKFGLEGAVLGLIFLLHNPNLSDPLAPDIARDEENFEENVKKYMRGEDVEGRIFTADFLKDLQAQSTKDESADKIVETSNSVDNTDGGKAANIQSDNGVNNSNGDNSATTQSDFKDNDTLLNELKQLGLDGNEAVNGNDEDACTLVSLDNETAVLVPYESTDIIQDIESASETDQLDTMTTEVSQSAEHNDDDINDKFSAVNSIVNELVENAMNASANDEDGIVSCVATDSSRKETDYVNVCVEVDKLTIDNANATMSIVTYENWPLVRTDLQNVVCDEVTLRKPGFSRQKSKEYVNDGCHLLHACASCASYIRCRVLHTFRRLTRLYRY